MIKNAKIYGLDYSFKASKYPMATNIDDCSYMYTDRIKKLASAPIGSGHDNFLNGIIVQFDLTFSQKAWVELQRYHFIDFVSSQSTMHRIDRFDLDSQMNGWVDEAIKSRLKELVEAYREDGSKDNFLRVIYNIPSGFQLTARMTTNYRQLKTIYFQRKTHRLPEWREFCKWIEKLPFMGEFLGLEAKNEEES